MPHKMLSHARARHGSLALATSWGRGWADPFCLPSARSRRRCALSSCSADGTAQVGPAKPGRGVLDAKEWRRRRRRRRRRACTGGHAEAHHVADFARLELVVRPQLGAPFDVDVDLRVTEPPRDLHDGLRGARRGRTARWRTPRTRSEAAQVLLDFRGWTSERARAGGGTVLSWAMDVTWPTSFPSA